MRAWRKEAVTHFGAVAKKVVRLRDCIFSVVSQS
jgi:hypothetical protein